MSGKTTRELANLLNLSIPDNLKSAKGWVGTLVERYLGVTHPYAALPDFADLGIELKTLPLNKQYKPSESTYVCTAPISIQANLETWHSSRVRAKLQEVLWVPFIMPDKNNIAECYFAVPQLITLDAETEFILQQDWEELMELLQLSHTHPISAHFGKYLQIRPKAAHGKKVTSLLDANGNITHTVPKGFYLRTHYTQMILKKYYCICY